MLRAVVVSCLVVCPASALAQEAAARAPSFICLSGDAIDPAFVCDGNDDCGDGVSAAGSDEAICLAFLQCGNGAGVVIDEVCDGEDQCGDGSDEDPCL